MAATPNLGLDLQATGSNVNTWGADLNTDVFTIIDSAMGGTQTLTFSSSDVTVTQTQSQNNFLILTGTLTANVNMIFSAIGRTFWVQNNCTGNFTLTATIASGATVVIPQMYGGSPMPLILDGTNCYAGQGYVPPGEIIYTSSPVTPFGYIPADGTAISRTAFPALNAQASAAGYAFPWGAGDGSSTFNVISVRGYFIRSLDDGAGIDPGRVFGSVQAAAFQSHTHTASVNDPGHQHGISTQSGTGSSQGPPVDSGNNVAGTPASTQSNSTGISITNASAGGVETRPINLAFRGYVKT